MPPAACAPTAAFAAVVPPDRPGASPPGRGGRRRADAFARGVLAVALAWAAGVGQLHADAPGSSPIANAPSPDAPARSSFGDVVAEPEGYRLHDYDAPVPEGLAGARTVDAIEVRALDARGAVVVDVVPEHRAPATLPADQLWLPPPHAGVPGATWLPDTGFGALDPVTERYFLEHLARASGGDRTRALVFYCRMDCWMSWNAAKRALEAGYANVHWFRDGIDDWRFEGYPTETLRPAPGARLPSPESR